MFYDEFIRVCENHSTTPAKVRKDLGISQSTMASWKSRGLTPKYETLQKLSDYFGVPIEVLLFGVTSEEWQQAAEKEVEICENENRKYWESVLFTGPIKRIDAALNMLNDAGKKKAVERVEELTEIHKYQRQEPPAAPSEGTDTTPTENASTGPQEGK